MALIYEKNTRIKKQNKNRIFELHSSDITVSKEIASRYNYI